MSKQREWNRREFIVKPILWAGAASVLAKTDVLASPVTETPKPILKRTLGKTGITLPVVSMGVMNADIPGLVRRSYELGIRHFDTAAGYQEGRNEQMVGTVVKEIGLRDTLTISTKQHVRDHRLSDAEQKQRFLDGVDASLKRLQMDHVDILYNHAVDFPQHAGAAGILSAMQEIKKAGKARFLGLSTHNTVAVLNEAMRLNFYEVFLVTLNYTMAHNNEILSTIEKASKSGAGIVAMKTQAGGTVRPDARLPKELPAASQTALLKWVLNHDFITTAIPGFSTYEHLEQDFSVARDLSYTADEKKFLEDKAFVADAEFCQQCGQCHEDCPKQVQVSQLMRAHMYAVQYRNRDLARYTLASLASGQGIDACRTCDSCTAKCRNTVNISRKIEQLKTFAI